MNFSKSISTVKPAQENTLPLKFVYGWFLIKSCFMSEEHGNGYVPYMYYLAIHYFRTTYSKILIKRAPTFSSLWKTTTFSQSQLFFSYFPNNGKLYPWDAFPPCLTVCCDGWTDFTLNLTFHFAHKLKFTYRNFSVYRFQLELGLYQYKIAF